MNVDGKPNGHLLHIDASNLLFNVVTPDNSKSKTDEFYKITNWLKLKNRQHHSKVLLNSFPMNGHTLGFCP